MDTSFRPPRRQRGTVLLFGLIAMTLLLLSAVALVRSFNASQFNAGNLAFKRDLTNQAERVWPVVLAAMQTGALSTPDKRKDHLKASNYSASTLQQIHSPSIPEALLDDGTFNTVGDPGKDIDVPDQAVKIRYMIDRLCSTTGLDSALGADKCTVVDSGAAVGGDAKNVIRAEDGSAGGAGALPKQVVYRLSIRVTGPRNTQSFYQTTFSL